MVLVASNPQEFTLVPALPQASVAPTITHPLEVAQLSVVEDGLAVEDGRLAM